MLRQERADGKVLVVIVGKEKERKERKRIIGVKFKGF